MITKSWPLHHTSHTHTHTRPHTSHTHARAPTHLTHTHAPTQSSPPTIAHCPVTLFTPHTHARPHTVLTSHHSPLSRHTVQLHTQSNLPPLHRGSYHHYSSSGQLGRTTIYWTTITTYAKYQCTNVLMYATTSTDLPTLFARLGCTL